MVGAAEVAAGHDQQFLRLGPLGEFLRAAARRADQQIKRPLRSDAFIAEGRQRVVQRAAVAVIGLDIRAERGAARDHMLQQRGRADVALRARRAGDRREQRLGVFRLLRDVDITKTLARQGERFGIGVAYDAVAVQKRQEADLRPVVDQLAIGLVGDEIDRMAVFAALLLQQRGERRKALAAVNDAGWVVRGVDDDRLGMLRQILRRRLGVDLKIGGVGRDDHVLHPRARGKHGILGEKRRKDQRLGILDGESGEYGRERRSGAAGKEQIPRSCPAGKAVVEILCNGLARLRRAGGGGIAVKAMGVAAGGKRGDRPVHARGRGHGGVADGKVKDVLPSDLGGSRHAVFKQIADARAVRAEFPLFLIYHIHASLFALCRTL